MSYLNKKDHIDKAWNDVSKSAMNQYLEESDCKYNKRGANYQGYHNTTITGKNCDVWTTYTYPGEHFPDGSVRRAENYCRNIKSGGINNENGPWCRVDDGGPVWEYCAVPECRMPRSCTAGLIENNNEKEIVDQKDIFECMVACIRETKFKCRSFDFTAENGRCILSRARSTDTSVKILHDDDYITCDNIASNSARNLNTNSA